MAYDAILQVAPDSTGKKVAMDQGTDAAGNTVYFQKALLVGDPADALSQLVEMNLHQLACLRAILEILNKTTNSTAQEDDFSIFTQE